MDRVRDDDGMTLIELLIAMTVMAFGISALVAGFSSGILAVNRGAKASTAGALADQQMEAYRQGSYGSLVVASQTNTTKSGPDGRTYWLGITISWNCPFSATKTISASPPSCSGTPASRAVKLVEIEVRDSVSTGKVLFTESSSFDASTG